MKSTISKLIADRPTESYLRWAKLHPKARYELTCSGVPHAGLEDFDTPLSLTSVEVLGAYGDPVAVPFEIWKMILNIGEDWTGYTHQWKKCDQRFKKICMASVDNEKEYKIARKMGWRTFRVRLIGDKILPGEMVCPASKEAGHKTNCNRCLGCSGTASKNKKNIVIIAHGSCIKLKRYYKIVKRIGQKKKYSHLVPELIRHKIGV